MVYHSQRKRALTEAPSRDISRNFWVSFCQYLSRLADQNYLCMAFGDSCPDGHPVGSNDSLIQAVMREEFGDAKWPYAPEETPSTEQVLDIVEFFYRHVAAPAEQWYHSYCQSYHPSSYDVAKGRYSYTIEINKKFARFGHPYVMRGGVVRLTSDTRLDQMVWGAGFRMKDQHLAELLDSARSCFYDRSGTKKVEGLRSIVDAFERVKTLEDNDKRQSITKTIGKITPDKRAAGLFDAHVKNLTDLANQFQIRHHEADKTPLGNGGLTEYFFYAYYSFVLLALRQYGLADVSGEFSGDPN